MQHYQTFKILNSSLYKRSILLIFSSFVTSIFLNLFISYYGCVGMHRIEFEFGYVFLPKNVVSKPFQSVTSKEIGLDILCSSSIAIFLAI